MVEGHRAAQSPQYEDRYRAEVLDSIADFQLRYFASRSDSFDINEIMWMFFDSLTEKITPKVKILAHR